jgi:hypothetical protein
MYHKQYSESYDVLISIRRYGSLRDSHEPQYDELFKKIGAAANLEVLEIEIRVTSLASPPSWFGECIRSVCGKLLKLKSFSITLQYAENIFWHGIEAIDRRWVREVDKIFETLGIKSDPKPKDFIHICTMWVWKHGEVLSEKTKETIRLEMNKRIGTLLQ